MEQLKKLTFAELFCLLVMLLCFAFVFWISYMSFYHQGANEISEMKIAVIGWGGAVIGYIVGSTASSRKKDEVISKQNNTTNP